MAADSLELFVAAENDVRDIVRYIARDNARAAGLFEGEFDQALMQILAFPEAGRRISFGDIELRKVRVSARFRRYLIVYRLADAETVHVLRVLHGAMDLQAHLAQSKLR